MLATKNQRILTVNDDLRAAAKKGNLAVIRFLVEEGVDKDDADENDDNKTALMIAAREGHAKVLEYLVEQGADKEKGNIN